MRYKYKEIDINGESRIVEMQATNGTGSDTYISSLTDEYGREIYQLQNGEPVEVGPIELDDNKKRKIVKERFSDLVDAILDNQITSISDLKAWVQGKYNSL